MLQSDLFEKQAAHVRVEDELSLLRDSNESLVGALEEAERSNVAAQRELHQARGAHLVSDKAVAHLRSEVGELENRCDHLVGELDSTKRSVRLCPSVESLTGKVGRQSPSHACCVLLLLLVGLLGACLGAGVACAHQAWRWEQAPALSPAAGGLAGGVALAAQLASGGAHAAAGAAAGSGGVLPLALDEILQPVAALDDGDADILSVEAVTDDATSNESRWPGENRSHSSDDADVKALGDAREARWVHADGGPWITDGIGCSAGHDDVRIARQVAQLEDGTVDEKTEAALVLGILATTGPEKQACIVRAGAVAQLVELLRGDWPEARGQAAVALRALASNSTYNKVAIVRAGAIQPLIQILKHDSVDVQEVAAGALETLAETNNQVEIVQAGAIVSLVALLNDERPKAREEAAKTLVVLAQNVAARAAIAQVGAIPLLVELLKDEVAEVRVQAAAALRNLAAEDER